MRCAVRGQCGGLDVVKDEPEDRKGQHQQQRVEFSSGSSSKMISPNLSPLDTHAGSRSIQRSTNVRCKSNGLELDETVDGAHFTA